MRTILSGLLTLAIFACAAAPAVAQTEQSSHNRASGGDIQGIGRVLRAGGYVILVRHGATFSNQADIDPFNLADVTSRSDGMDMPNQASYAETYISCPRARNPDRP